MIYIQFGILVYLFVTVMFLILFKNSGDISRREEEEERKKINKKAKKGET